MFEVCFLHIGTEKTGTSSIQEFMLANRDRLNRLGVLYPDSLGPFNHRKLRNFAVSTHDHLMGAEVRQHHAGVAGFRAELTQAFLQEIHGTTCRKLVVSDEHFHSALTTTEEIRRLRSFLEPCCAKFVVIVYLRRQDELCRSFYSEHIKIGKSDDKPIFPDGISYYYDYRSLIENYESVFGVGSVLVRRFEKARLVNGDVVDDFAAIVGLGDVASWQRSSRRNVSLNALGLRFLAELNKHIPQAIDNKPNPERADLRPLLETNYAGEGWPIARQKAVEFYQQYREINEWVRQRFFAESTSLFDEDFSRYPVSATEQAFGFDDAIEVAATLWRHQASALQAARSEVAKLRADLACKDEQIRLLD